MSDEFVKKITDQLNEEDRASERKAELSLLRNKTIEANAPAQWHAVRAWVKNFCDQANVERPGTFFVRVTPNMQLIVDAKTANGDRLIEVRFNENTYMIGYDHATKTFKPSLKPDDSFSFTSGDRFVSVEEMGEIIIRTLLGS
jgi:hypothetical protein